MMTKEKAKNILKNAQSFPSAILRFSETKITQDEDKIPYCDLTIGRIKSKYDERRHWTQLLMKNIYS